MYSIVILACLATIAPRDCTEQTARVVMRGPDAPNSIACGFLGQAFFADSALGKELHADEYIKVVCRNTVTAPALATTGE
jgi:hypothetical protein